MFESSLLVSFFVSCWEKYLIFYRASFFAVVINKISSLIFSIWNHSAAKKLLFNDFGMEGRFQNSIYAKVFAKINSLSSFTSKLPYQDSLFIRFISFFCKNILYFNIRIYGTFICFFSAVQLFNRSHTQVTAMLSLALYMLGLFFILINESLAQMLGSSVFAKYICSFFCVDLGQLKYSSVYRNLFMYIAIVAGVAFGIVGVLLGPLLGIVAVFGCIGFALILYKTEAGIYAAAFFIPLLPTKIILGLAFLTVVSFAIKLLFAGRRLSLNLTDFFASLYAILLIYSVFISYIPSNSAVMAFTYVLFILFYFAVKNTIKTKNQLLTLVSLLIVSAFFVSFIGIVQKNFGLNIDTEAWIDTTLFDSTQQRIYATLDNPNVLGEYLLFTIPIAFGALYYFKDYFNKFISACMLATMGICIMLTLSRGAWLGLIGAICVFALIRDRRLVFVGIIIVALSPILLPQSILERFLSIGNMTDTSTTYRVSIWQSSVKLIADFWPIGIGLGTSVFMLIFQRYAYSASYAQHSHNLFLQIIVDNGIIGFVLFASLIVVFFKNLLTQLTRTKDDFLNTFSCTLVAGMTGYLIQSITDNTWYNYRIVMYFWLVIALSAICKNLCLERNRGVSC